MYAEERQQTMAQLVTQLGRVSVVDLAERFDVTTETVRRDLSTLERLGLLRRVHGGAVPASSLAVMESALADRDSANPLEKDAIALAALSLLPPPGSMVLLDAGSTTSRLAGLMVREHQLTVVTHSVPIASRLATAPNVTLHLLPGRVRHTTGAAVGTDTVDALRRLRADVAFIATNGFTLAHGLSTPDRDEAAVKRAVVAAGRRVILLCDSSKFGTESAIRFAEVTEIDTIVTDAGISPTHLSALQRLDLELVIA